ncbi:hypothetical protein DL766_006362 [Monosporascus sp. MC13-8B]|uniref:Zn(2)-C6 fungal-type domain-containing protein n=1 Tax=Monosporascus cannonballus TaxID=155416 RepID=A0ABY0HLK0_9PEZI|nr:hypothetical protein DL763_008311 [Monosporascus cannonballus]RYO95372.1 hypothetical protein DL762_000114 [Monosporascus cannonballus]RYP27525.1 hypothetical protein DL766_006362 [Monosporascus sp. MC13-8B]
MDSTYTQDISPSSNGSPSDLYSILPQDTTTEPHLMSAIPASVGTNPDSRAAPTVTAACLPCRGKHLKCDGAKPCSRCKSTSSECIYIASRRGYKGPRKNPAANPNKRHASDSPPSVGSGSDSCPMLLGATVASPAPPSVASFNPSLVFTEPPLTPFVTPAMNSMQLYRNPYLNASNGALVEAPFRPQRSLSDRCIDSFYFHFFPGHPAVLPKEQLLKMAKERNLEHLMAAMKWVGSLYIDAGPTRASLFDEAMRLIYAPDVTKDGFLVQAMSIVLIGLDGSCEQERARGILLDVEQLAVEIGLYTRAYATVHGTGNPILEESWRRTWWDLLVVDGMVAGVHRATNFLLYDILADVALPCEERQYLSGNIPQPMYMEDFDDQLFSGEEREFSSFTYRIAAIKNLGRMMRLPNNGFPSDDNIDRIESHLSNWRLHLPASKRNCLTEDCQVDEMMFQAHMIIHACSIMLHQPLSQLDTSPAREVTACAPHRAVQSGDDFNIHTKHIVTAACEVSKLVTYSVPITTHTHFFTCVLTMSSIVHLSKWALYFIADEDDLRQQISLNIGGLNKLSAVWKAAQKASGQVKGVAQEIYRTKKAQQQENPSYWIGFTQEQIISSMAADEGIMGEINTIL